MFSILKNDINPGKLVLTCLPSKMSAQNVANVPQMIQHELIQEFRDATIEEHEQSEQSSNPEQLATNVPQMIQHDFAQEFRNAVIEELEQPEELIDSEQPEELPLELEQTKEVVEREGIEQFEQHDHHEEDKKQNDQVDVEKNNLNWNGQRPSAGALHKFKEMLAEQLEIAEQYLKENINQQYSKVRVNLFDKIHWECTDTQGNVVAMNADCHKSMYGALRRFVPDPTKNFEHQRWENFFNRDRRICKFAKSAADEDNTLTVFQQFQVLFRKKGLYLYDRSHIKWDYGNERYMLKISIRLYRTQQVESKYRTNHGYDRIPEILVAHEIPTKISKGSNASRTSKKTGSANVRDKQISSARMPALPHAYPMYNLQRPLYMVQPLPALQPSSALQRLPDLQYQMQQMQMQILQMQYLQQQQMHQHM